VFRLWRERDARDHETLGREESLVELRLALIVSNWASSSSRAVLPLSARSTVYARGELSQKIAQSVLVLGHEDGRPLIGTATHASGLVETITQLWGTPDPHC
jgi:hypothetical protein